MSLQQLQLQKLEETLDICDRKYKFKTYKKCFIGSDAIKVIISLNLASNQNEAMEFGNKLIDSNIIQHVTKKHAFKNEKLFYRFTDQYYKTISYKSKLDELNSLPAPEILFKDINSFIANIQRLSKEYSMEWNKHHSQFNLDLRTMMRSSKHQKSSVSVEDIQSFTKKMKNLQTSVWQLVEGFVVKNQIKNCVSNDIEVNNLSIDDNTTIPSLGTKASGKRYKKRKSAKRSRSTTKSKYIDGSFPMLNHGPVNAFTYHLNLLQQSHDNFNQFYGCALGGCDMKTDDVEMKEIEVFLDECKEELNLDQQAIAKYFHDNYYGQGATFESPFGIRPIIYCDWTASGKLLNCVEDYLQKEMYPLYANTHTTTSITGIQTSKFREEARSIILNSIGGESTKDVVLFTGSGVTGAINKISKVLMGSDKKSYKPQSTIVFISIYEHNSNLYIWKELGCKVIVIPEQMDNPKKGGIDLRVLEKHLKFYSSATMKNKYNLLIGSFTAASNVSGIIAPIDETTLLLHKYGALSFWDYATAGPYLDINMTNKENPLLSKDAVFISPHKYLAGPGTPGILCAKKQLFQNNIPVIPGGGTVYIAYGVNDGEWEYLDHIEEREEGGTPDIIGSVRAAFSFMIKDNLSTHFIEETEKRYLKYFLEETKSLNNLKIMGNIECDRLPVLSFVITHSKIISNSSVTKYLHHNFIAALFNDLFGIQGRGGCACAGMYGVQVLEISQDEINHVLTQMRESENEMAKPGYFRINLHYTLNEKELKYIVDAVKYICNNGWKFLPLYDIDPITGNIFHREIQKKPEILRNQLQSLMDISFNGKCGGEMIWTKNAKQSVMENNDFQKYFDFADNILTNLDEYLPTRNEFVSEENVNDDKAWYWLPSELYEDVTNSVHLHYVSYK